MTKYRLPKSMTGEEGWVNGIFQLHYTHIMAYTAWKYIQYILDSTSPPIGPTLFVCWSRWVLYLITQVLIADITSKNRLSKRVIKRRWVPTNVSAHSIAWLILNGETANYLFNGPTELTPHPTPRILMNMGEPLKFHWVEYERGRSLPHPVPVWCNAVAN